MSEIELFMKYVEEQFKPYTRDPEIRETCDKYNDLLREYLKDERNRDRKLESFLFIILRLFDQVKELEEKLQSLKRENNNIV